MIEAKWAAYTAGRLRDIYPEQKYAHLRISAQAAVVGREHPAIVVRVRTPTLEHKCIILSRDLSSEDTARYACEHAIHDMIRSLGHD